MQINLLWKENLIVPQSAHESDTGYDVVAASDPRIEGEWDNKWHCWRAIDYIEYDSQLQIEPEHQHKSGITDRYGYTLVFPRSSICKYNLALANSVAVVDHAYRGNFLFRFRYLWQPKDLIMDNGASLGILPDPTKIYKKGDKIGQIVAAWKEPIKWNMVEHLGQTIRDINGFGSSGK